MAAACVLLAWSAESARAAGALDVVVAAAPAVTAQVPTAAAVAVDTPSVRPAAEPVRKVVAPVAAAPQQATTILRRAGEPVRKAVAPVAAAPHPAVAAAPVPSAPAVPTERVAPAVTTEPVAPAGHDAVRATASAAPGHARGVEARVAAKRNSDRRKQRSKRRAAGGVAGRGIDAPVQPTTADPQSVLLAAAERPSVAVAAGWRNRTATAGTHRPQGEPGTAPLSRSGGATSVAAASSAAATAAGLLGLLLLLTFAAQRLGGLIRLRPDWAPPAPFLALPERPG